MNLENKIKLDRPLVSLDVESTGTNSVRDRIVILAMVKLVPPSNPGGEITLEEREFKFNPGFAMSDEVIAIHGITNEEAATFFPFSEAVGNDILRFIEGCDLLGYNLWNLDLPMLSEELDRVGLELSMAGREVVDAGNIFKKKEERTLTAAVRFYCGEEFDGAHNALFDSRATVMVLAGQARKYEDVGKMTIAEMAAYSLMEPRVDIAGKIGRAKDGDYIYNFGDKTKGQRVRDNLSMAEWMLSRDFPEDTKRHLRRILREIEDEYEKARPVAEELF